MSLLIQNGGVLDLGATTGHSFGEVSGEGILRLQTNNFPGGNFSAFTSTGGGTVEYYNPADNFTLQRLEYNNLTFSFGNASRIVTLAGNLVVNGDMTVNRGILRIGNDNNARNVQIGVRSVDNNGHIELGTGNANHRVIVNGDFNYGVVRFTNQMKLLTTIAIQALPIMVADLFSTIRWQIRVCIWRVKVIFIG